MSLPDDRIFRLKVERGAVACGNPTLDPLKIFRLKVEWNSSACKVNLACCTNPVNRLLYLTFGAWSNPPSTYGDSIRMAFSRLAGKTLQAVYESSTNGFAVRYFDSFTFQQTVGSPLTRVCVWAIPSDFGIYDTINGQALYNDPRAFVRACQFIPGPGFALRFRLHLHYIDAATYSTCPTLAHMATNFPTFPNTNVVALSQTTTGNVPPELNSGNNCDPVMGYRTTVYGRTSIVLGSYDAVTVTEDAP